VLDARTWTGLRRAEWLCFLKRHRKPFFLRVSKSKHRPLLLSAGDPYAQIVQLLGARKPFYDRCSFRVATDALRLLRWLPHRKGNGGDEDRAVRT